MRAATKARLRAPDVWVPWTRHPAATLAALGRGGIYPRLAYMDTPTRYGELLAALWRAGQEFTVIEHDIVPHSWTVYELDGCPLRWCGYPYANTDRYAASLGCTRFRASLMQDYPDLLADVRSRRWGNLPAGHWMALADHLRDALTERGESMHVHLPPVGHLNTGQQIESEWARGWCHWPVRLRDLAYIP